MDDGGTEKDASEQYNHLANRLAVSGLYIYFRLVSISVTCFGAHGRSIPNSQIRYANLILLMSSVTNVELAK